MMSYVKKCDICGAIIKPRKGVSVTIVKDQPGFDSMLIDMCTECYASKILDPYRKLKLSEKTEEEKTEEEETEETEEEETEETEEEETYDIGDELDKLFESIFGANIKFAPKGEE